MPAGCQARGASFSSPSKSKPGRRGVTDAEAKAWAADLTGLGRKYFFSLNRYLFLAVK